LNQPIVTSLSLDHSILTCADNRLSLGISYGENLVGHAHRPSHTVVPGLPMSQWLLDGISPSQSVLARCHRSWSLDGAEHDAGLVIAGSSTGWNEYMVWESVSQTIAIRGLPGSP
jgi:hypothetical protein